MRPFRTATATATKRIYTAAVDTARDFMWIGADEGMGINDTVHDVNPTAPSPAAPAERS